MHLCGNHTRNRLHLYCNHLSTTAFSSALVLITDSSIIAVLVLMTLYLFSWHCTCSHDTVLVHMTLYLFSWHCTCSHDTVLVHMTLYLFSWHCTCSHDTVLVHMTLYLFSWHCTCSHDTVLVLMTLYLFSWHCTHDTVLVLMTLYLFSWHCTCSHDSQDTLLAHVNLSFIILCRREVGVDTPVHPGQLQSWGMDGRGQVWVGSQQCPPVAPSHVASADSTSQVEDEVGQVSCGSIQ